MPDKAEHKKRIPAFGRLYPVTLADKFWTLSCHGAMPGTRQKMKSQAIFNSLNKLANCKLGLLLP